MMTPGTWRLVAAPEAEPVTLAEAKTHLRIDGEAEDALLTRLLTVARVGLEEWTGRAFLSQTWLFEAERLFGVLELPRPPLVTVDEIAYDDLEGVAQVLDPGLYQVDASRVPARVRPAPGASWPAVADAYGAVRVTYTAGYGEEAAAVPQPIRHAILLTVGHLYEHREATTDVPVRMLPFGVEMLLGPFRVWGPW